MLDVQKTGGALRQGVFELEEEGGGGCLITCDGSWCGDGVSLIAARRG